MKTQCAKCGAETVEGRIPSPLKYLFGFKADDQKHFSFETNIQKACAWIMTAALIALAAMGGVPRAHGAERGWPASARELLEVLKATEGPVYAAGIGPMRDWVKEEDVPFLVSQLDSTQECAHVVLLISSHLPTTRSTVGHQAAYLIEGFWKRLYPTQLASDAFVPDYKEIRRWYSMWSRSKGAEPGAGGARTETAEQSARLRPERHDVDRPPRPTRTP